MTRLFILSPASCGGERARLLLNEGAAFDAARRLRSPGGMPLGDAFAFMSGLYFRGKLVYAQAFARPASGTPGVLIITPCDGLRPPGDPVDVARLTRYAGVPIDRDEPRYRTPLMRAGRDLARHLDVDAEVILLGSVASGKYVDLLGEVFGSRLRFPAEFVGRGDMSRGGLLLRCVAERRELTYIPVAGARRRGSRPPRLVPRPGLYARAVANDLGADPPRPGERVRASDALASSRAAHRGRHPAEPPPGARAPPARSGHGRPPAGVARGAPHQPRQAVLAGSRSDQARSAPVLRGCFGRAAAASAGPRHGHEALPQRSRRGILLHEAGPLAAPAVDRAVLDRAPVGQRHRLSHDPGSGLAAVGGEPRVHRPEPVVRAVRRRRPPRLRPLRPRSGQGHAADALRACPRGRSARAGWIEGPGHARLRQDVRSRGIHVYVPIVRGPNQKDVWDFAKVFAIRLAALYPKCSRPSTGSPAVPPGTSWSTTTRTPGAAPWPRSIPCARTRPRPYPPR